MQGLNGKYTLSFCRLTRLPLVCFIGRKALGALRIITILDIRYSYWYLYPHVFSFCVGPLPFVFFFSFCFLLSWSWCLQFVCPITVLGKFYFFFFSLERKLALICVYGINSSMESTMDMSLVKEEKDTNRLVHSADEQCILDYFIFV